MYTLQVNFTDEQLDAIAATGKKVILVKEATKSGKALIAWVAFFPMQENIITWETKFSVYASTTLLNQGGAKIKMSSHMEANKGHLYRFEKNHFNEAGAAGKGPTTYSIFNAMQGHGMLTFGLAQTASINGVEAYSPVSAIPAEYNDTIDLTPIEKVSIFLQSSLDNGTVISTVTGTSKELDFTSMDALAVKYDSINKAFVSDTVRETKFTKRLCAIK